MSDLINPFAGYRMSQGWKDGSHVNNPAMDYATPVGFEFVAPASGVYRRLASNLSRTDTSAAGHMGELLIVGGRWDGYRIRFAHSDHHIAAHGARVEQGRTVLAATGNTGYVRPRPTAATPRAGAHVHTYGLTPKGERWNWTLYASAPTPAGDKGRPFDPEEDEMNTDQDARLKNIEKQLSSVLNALNDPTIGIHDHVLKAAGRSAEAVAIAKNVEGIVAATSNTLNDPKTGVWPVVNALRASLDKVLAAVKRS